MTFKVAQRRTSAARKVTVRTAAALAAGLALVMGAAATGQAAAATPAGGTAPAKPGCDGAEQAGATSAAPAWAAAHQPAPVPALTGTAAQNVAYGMPGQLPIGLWSDSGVTLRTPVTKGTVRLDVSSKGFSTDSLTVQRYEPSSRRWVDLDSKPGSGSFPTRGVLTFPVSAPDASPKHPVGIALRLQDLDRPGTLTVAASLDDGRGHTYRAPVRTAEATRPKVTLTGWDRGATLRRGGTGRTVTVTVKNTTDRAYPALNGSYYAYGAGGSHALTPKDLTLSQYRTDRGWVRVPLVAGGCDPGMSAALLPTTGKRLLAPGETAVYRLKVAVARSAPRDVTHADAGFTVGNGDASFHSQELPFTIPGGTPGR
ncbi:hypothetical protein [Streptomyces hesseae]|uniref:Uncharacterized protein n=1 Tax=Streptomyces hesseae TaxID=3075519 RepID=A0ABU2SJ32_9ACTN|nr:hypothetical protein [Streptomyces sp. DSM 40473]MDT0447914.1 hypothetical protein [Streptomyces sp. DSM 40473]